MSFGLRICKRGNNKYLDTKITVFKTLANENLDILFEALGLTLKDNGSYYNGACPVHNGDNCTAFSFSKDDGIWKCWTKGCHMSVGSDIYGLVRAIRNCSFKEAVSFVEECLNSTDEEFADIVERANNKKFTREQERALGVKKETYSEELIAKLSRSNDYLLKRGFSPEILSEYQAGFCDNEDSSFYNRMIIPVRDDVGDLIGFTGRIVDDSLISKECPKWKHEGPLHNCLFDFNRNKQAIKEMQTIILVEGPLKVMRLRQAGVDISNAIFGTSFSDKQKRLLLESGAFTVVLMLDDDNAGRRATENLYKILDRFFYVKVPDFKVKDIDKVEPSALINLLLKDPILKEFVI